MHIFTEIILSSLQYVAAWERKGVFKGVVWKKVYAFSLLFISCTIQNECTRHENYIMCGQFTHHV